MSARELDRGMRAVERVRGVRERDSRIGLQQALRERETCRTRLADLEERLAQGSAWQGGDAGSYQVLRLSLLALGEQVGEATRGLEAAGHIADAAHAHWSADKTRLSAVESLLERRAEARRAERARREVAALDDIAAQLWTRARRSTPSNSPEGAR